MLRDKTLQIEIRHGSRLVIITSQHVGKFSARLYVNHGETASLSCWRGRSQRGAEQWAQKVLSR